MSVRSIFAPAAVLLACAALASPSQAALVCSDATGQCSIDLSTVTINFDIGLSSFQAYAYADSMDYGYPGSMPTLNEVDTAGRAGFTFNPELYANLMGGYGAYGSMGGSFEFTNLIFTAKSGYQIDSIEFGVAGHRYVSGDAGATLGVPGTPVFNGENFESSALRTSDTTTFGAGFSGYADYEEGPDGTALSFGSSEVGFDSARIVAHVSAVPEPESFALLLAGLPLLALARRRSR